MHYPNRIADVRTRSPWWFVYQPVSYRLNSRHGDVNALRSMITACRENGVRVYADAVVNHMVRALPSTSTVNLNGDIL